MLGSLVDKNVRTLCGQRIFLVPGAAGIYSGDVWRLFRAAVASSAALVCGRNLFVVAKSGKK